MSTSAGISAIYNGGLVSMHGSGLSSMIKNLHGMTKDRKVISSLLRKGADLAASKGYGRRRKRRTRRTRR